MASTIDIYLDRSGGLLVGGSAPYAKLPKLTRNDEYIARVRVLERNANGTYVESQLTTPAFKLGIGNVGDTPSYGQFKVTIGATTSSAISYNATTTQFFNAISAIAGNVTVATFGDSGSSWLVTAATSNTALSFGGSSFTLFPDSTVLVNTRRFPAASIYAEQVVQLVRNPVVYSDIFTSTTGDQITLTKVQDGSATRNETYKLFVPSDISGGSFSLSYNGYSVNSSYNTSVSQLNSQLSAITGIGTGNISVQSDNAGGFVIAFVNQLGNQDLSTPLLLDASGAIGTQFYQTTVTMSTSQLDDLFVEANADTINPSIEIELTESGKRKTLLQSPVTVRRDLITTGSAVPANQAGYYTKTEVDAGFVPNTTSNVDSTNRVLYGASAQKSVDWANRSLLDTSNTTQLQWGTSGVTIGSAIYAKSSGVTIGSSLFANATGVTIGGDINTSGNINITSSGGMKIGTTTSQKLSFFGNSPVVQPTDENVVSCLAQLGLFKDASTTYGVFPNSSKTLTTTAAVWFGGSIAANDFHSITVSVTGANINDLVLLGRPAAVCGGLTFQGSVATANVVSITAQNATNSAQNPATATYRITVIGY